MSNLPPGWDLDYDGSRWFYKYRSSGLIQYTFPREGDEFPDYVDASAPAPALAPEERLESQQQVRRKGDVGIASAPKPKSSAMSATGGPVSDTWDDGEDDGYAHFQPENFMFLGPGAYTDISPLVDDDENSAKSKVVSPAETESKATPDAASERTLLSPPVSSVSTPAPSHSVVAVETPPVTTASLAESQDAHISIPEMHMLDSLALPPELPEETRFNPVGVLAEMPTEDTAVAHVELHPDPVEMGDNTVLAPVEKFYLNSGIAELPTQNSPVEREKVEPPPPRRRANSQPVQRVYPFQPTEDDDPDRPPTPLGSQATPASTPQPPTDTILQPPNRSYTPFTPSTGPTPASISPVPSNAELATVVVNGPDPDSLSESLREASGQQSAHLTTSTAVSAQTSPSSTAQQSSARPPRPSSEDEGTPPPVPEKDTASAVSGHVQRFQQRPHSNSSPGPVLQPSQQALAQQLRGVPQSLQLGTPPPLPLAVPGKGKAKGKQRATPSPLGFGKRTVSHPAPTPNHQYSGPMIFTPPNPPSGRSAPDIPLTTPSPLEIRSNPPVGISGSSHQFQVTSTGPSIAQSLSASGLPRGDENPMCTGTAENSNSAQQRPQAVSQPQEQHVAGSYFPPQPVDPSPSQQQSGTHNPVEGRSQQEENTQTPPNGSPTYGSRRPEAAPPVKQAGPPIPPKEPLVRAQTTPFLHDPSLGHFLDPITEQPEHEDAESLARKASLASQTSSHRHSMPALPIGLPSPHDHIAAGWGPGSAQSTPQPSVQQTNPLMAPPIAPRMAGPGAPNPAMNQAIPQQLAEGLARQQLPPAMYTHTPMPVTMGPPKGKPSAFAQEKGKSKWLAKLLKTTKPSPKVSQPQQPQHPQQQMWHGPHGLVIPPNQAPGPVVPWSPGSVGATLALARGGSQPVFPPPVSSSQTQQAHAPGFQPGGNPGQIQQRQRSGSVPTSSPGAGQQQGQRQWPVPPTGMLQPLPAQPVLSNPMQPMHQPAAPAPPAPPAPTNLSAQPAPPSQPPPSAAPQPMRSTALVRAPSNAERTQAPHTSGPMRTESVRSDLTSVSGTGGPARSESVRSDLTTISTSEARVHPVLKPQIVQVSRVQTDSRPQSHLPPNNGATTSWAGPQAQYDPPRGTPNLGTNGQPSLQKHDSLRVAPLLQKRLSAEGGEGSSGRESMVSEISSAGSGDSRRVSVLSTDPVVPRKMVAAADYSGGGWGDGGLN